MVLATSDMKGACYVETKNLDGETNLKTKTAHKNLRSIFSDINEFKNLNGYLNCEQPNNSIYKFEGNIKVAQ